MGRVLAERYGLSSDPLFRKVWSSAALIKKEYHRKVIEAHLRYMEVGAEIITTNSYGTQPNYYTKGEALIRQELSAGEGTLLEELIHDHAKLSAQLAVQARQEFYNKNNKIPNPKIQIFGGIGPMWESHRPDLFMECLSKKGSHYVRDHFASLAKALLTGGADGILFETLNCWKEAELGLMGLEDALKELGLQNEIEVVVCLEGALRSDDGQDFKPRPGKMAPSVAQQCLDYKKQSGMNIVGFGFNCVPPEDIVAGLQAIADDEKLTNSLKESGIRLAAYANLQEFARQFFDTGYSTDHKRKGGTGSGKCPNHLQYIQDFIDLGASIVGGCCGSVPEDIEKIVEHFSLDKTANE